MGIRLFSRSEGPCDCDGNFVQKELPKSPNPNPYRFTILGLNKSPSGQYMLVRVLYPDCTTFDGIKLVLVKATEAEIKKATCLDPHFKNEGGNLHVIARYEPSTLGAQLALAALNML